MIVGLLSDTHDRYDAAAVAVRTLKAADAEYLIHCGDVGSEQILDLLAGIPAAFVWGNNDYDRAELKRYAQHLGITCCDSFGELMLGGKQFAITHGDDAKLIKRLLLEQRHDYLLLGHTHVRQDERIGTLRVINPGALHRAAVKSVATLDTASDLLRFLTVKV